MLRKRKKYKISSISILCTGTLSWPESFCVILFTWWVPYGINVVLNRKTPTFGPVTKRLQHYGLVHTMLHYTLITALCCIIPWLQHYAALYPNYSIMLHYTQITALCCIIPWLQHYAALYPDYSTMLHYTLITALCCTIPWLQHYAALYPDYSTVLHNTLTTALCCIIPWLQHYVA